MGALILAFVGGGLFFYSSKKPGSSTQSQSEIIQDLKKAHYFTVSNHMSSPLGKAWTARDYAAVRTQLKESPGYKQIAEKMQASIFILDQLKHDFKNEPAVKPLQEDLVAVLVSEANKAGIESRVKNYTAKVLAKLGPLSPETAKDLEAYMLKQETSAQELFVGYFITQSPLRKSVKTILLKNTLKAESAQLALMQISLIKDDSARRDVLSSVLQNFSKIPAQVQPLAAKQLFLNQGLLKKDMNHLLDLAARSEDSQWQDAFLVGVRELGLGAKYKEKVRTIQSKSKVDSVRLLAHSILSDVSGVQ